jgi:hypothetical protein
MSATATAQRSTCSGASVGCTSNIRLVSPSSRATRHGSILNSENACSLYISEQLPEKARSPRSLIIANNVSRVAPVLSASGRT